MLPLFYFIFYSAIKGWTNPPLHFSDEPCCYKILDLIGDMSLFAQFGNQGLPVAHIVAYKACAIGSVFPIFNIFICQIDFHCVKMMYFVQPNLLNSPISLKLNLCKMHLAIFNNIVKLL